jgi:hypothetical protein
MTIPDTTSLFLAWGIFGAANGGFASVLVPVMHVGVMSMRMRQGLVPVDMRMRLLAVPSRFMGMPMMLIMSMNMFMRHRIVNMQVRMVFAEMKPYPHAHERGSCQ